MTNTEIARQLRTYATDLARGGDNLYRIRAVRQAAMAVLGIREPVEQLLANRGRPALEAVPGLGRSLAETIANYVETGEWVPSELSRPRRSRLISQKEMPSRN